MRVTDSGEAAAAVGGPPLPKRSLSIEQAMAELMENVAGMMVRLAGK